MSAIGSGGSLSYLVGYKLHIFYESADFVVLDKLGNDLDIEYLIVGGGGAGGQGLFNGAGGGAGGQVVSGI